MPDLEAAMLAEAGPEYGGGRLESGDGKYESESEPEARRANGFHIGRSGRGGEERGEEDSDERDWEEVEDFFKVV
jgi:hypothetical protein